MSWFITLHLATVLPALAIGAALFAMKKGTPLHKNMGRAYVFLMAFTSLISFFIAEINSSGGFSPIHLLSVFTLLMLAAAVYFARRGRIHSHQRAMIGVFGGAVAAGIFAAAIPGRVVYDFLFSVL